ncbi:MAG: C39 family peptidase [Eggerthellaceae bacterium]|jgi:uncharacterized protein YvpB|nr:C39 family peptidase [Eggerthellaceae bacterium]MDR2721471.1 C39 family peptidase [Coriobacteriaceae bacterium]
MTEPEKPNQAGKQSLTILAIIFFLTIVGFAMPGNLGQEGMKKEIAAMSPFSVTPLSASPEFIKKPYSLDNPLPHTLFLGQWKPDPPTLSVLDPSFPLASYTQKISFISQYPELPTGCEAVSLTIVLSSMGFELEKTTIAKSYLPYSDGDFVNSFVGDPYTADGMTIYPPGLTKAANDFFTKTGSVKRAFNISGVAFDELITYIDKGYPVVVWTTIDNSFPDFTDLEIDGWRWYKSEHCVVLYGLDRETNQVFIADPVNGEVQYSADIFRTIFEACGSMAMVIY